MTLIAFDCETSSLNPFTGDLLGVSIAYDEHRVAWIKMNCRDLVVPQPILSDPNVTKVGHNTRFDRKYLALKGIALEGPYHDTLLMAQLINENAPLGLKALSLKYFGASVLYRKQALDEHLAALKLKMGDLNDPRVDQELVGAYANEDTSNTLKLYEVLKGLMTERQWAYYTEEMMPCEDVLMAMELAGVKIDVEKLAIAEDELTKRLAVIKTALDTEVDIEVRAIRQILLERANAKRKKKTEIKPEFNWNSSVHKVILFYNFLGLKRFTQKKTKKGKYSLRKTDLKALELPEGKLKKVIGLYLDYQTFTTLLTTFVLGIKERLHNGRIHAEFYQASRESYKAEDEGGTVTGRLSHRNPNLANLPSREADYWRGKFVKDFFIPDTQDHIFIYGDYSQIELRVAAHLSQDPLLLQAYQEGRDLHDETKDYLNSTFKLNLTRGQAKTINFAIIYGAGGYRLCEILGWPTTDRNVYEGDRISDNLLKKRFPSLGQWIDMTIGRLRRDGQVESMFGRVRRLPDIFVPPRANRAIKQGLNFVVQSAAASVCKRAMIELYKQGFDIRDQIHDAIIVQARKNKVDCLLPKMKEIMENVVTLLVPLKVDPKVCETFLVD